MYIYIYIHIFFLTAHLFVWIPIIRSKLIFQKFKLSENCVVLCYCAASNGNFLPTFRDKMGPMGCPETSIRNYRHSLRNDPEEHGCHLRRGGSLKSLRVSELEKTATKWEELRGEYRGNMLKNLLIWAGAAERAVCCTSTSDPLSLKPL
jgi:hypothetical protein